MKRFLIGFLSLFTFLESCSQSLGTEIGIGSGVSIYQGDLSPHWLGAYSKPSYSFQLFAQQNLFPLFAIRATYAYAPIRDNENDYEGGVHKLRNFSFRSTIHEFSAQLLINPALSNGDEEVGNIHPYFFAGIGVGLTSVSRNWDNFHYSYPYWQSWVLPGLKADSLTKMPTAVVTFPVGMGVRYQITDGIAIYGEFNKRITQSEYLDGFSKAANVKENDGFSSFTMGVVLRRSDGGGGYGNGSRKRARTDCPKNVY